MTTVDSTAAPVAATITATETPASPAVERLESNDWYQNFDFLRAVFIVLVLIHHYNFVFTSALLDNINKGMWFAIEVFFVQSGYLISTQTIRSYQRRGSIGVGRFYLRRAFRILPLYYIALLFAYVGTEILIPEQHMSPIWLYLTFTQNLFDDNMFNPFLPSWSVCAEEHFYLIFPLLVTGVIAAPARLRKYLTIALILGIIVSQPLIRSMIWQRELPYVSGGPLFFLFHKYIYLPTYAHCESLAVGVGLGLVSIYYPKILATLQRYWALVAVALLSLIWLFAESFVRRTSYFDATIGMSAASLVCLLLTILSTNPRAWYPRFARPLVGLLAKILYPTYLIHMMFGIVYKHVLASYSIPSDNWTAFSGYFVTTCAIAWGLHMLVEQPCLKLRRRIESRLDGRLNATNV